MDFEQLETFLEVARLSSFSRAAEKRFRTQPAISSQIRALEEEVGAKLLDRSGGKVSITAAGKLFQKYAEETLESRKAVLTAIAEAERVPRGEIIVGANEGTCLHILPEVFAEFKKQYRDVGVLLFELGEDLGKDVQAGAFVGADNDLAARHALSFGDGCKDGFAGFKCFFSIFLEQLAGSGDRHLAAGAVEQLCADFFLQGADLGRDRGLGAKALLRSAGEGAQACDFEKGF